MKLEIRSLTCGYDKRPVLHRVSFSVETGEICCLLGPNGVGKTTLFKTLLGLLPPLDGQVLLDGQDTARWSAPRLARHLAYVSQQHQPPFPYLVQDVVAMGRISHAGYTGRLRPVDYGIAQQAMEDMGLLPLARRPYTDISGGERQLVMVARALAQQPRFLVLDEPAANLDYGNTVRVLERLLALREKGYGVLMTTHSPDQAFWCGTTAALLKADGTLDFGPPAEVVNERSMREVYGVDVRIVAFSDPGGRVVRLCTPRL